MAGHRTRRRVLAPRSAIATTHQTRSDTRPAQNFPKVRIHCHPQVLWLRQTLAALDLSDASMTNPNSGHLRYLRARAGKLEQRRLQAWPTRAQQKRTESNHHLRALSRQISRLGPTLIATQSTA